MKKYLFIVPIALMAQCISAQALTKNGSVVTESTVSTLKVGDVTYPNTKGTSGQVLSTDDDGVVSWTDATLVTDFTTDITVKGISIGQGPGSVNSGNIVLGSSALANNTTGQAVLAIGTSALQANTTGNMNLAIGTSALRANVTGEGNLAVGFQALWRATGSGNTAVGHESGGGVTNTNNTSVGHYAGNQNLGSNNTFLGANTGQLTPGSEQDNNTAIGYGAVVEGSNQIQLGNNQIEVVKTSGKLTTGQVTYPNIDGTYGQVLTTDGGGTASWTSPSTGGLATVLDGTNLSLDASHSGAIIYMTNNDNNSSLFYNINFLNEGFTCTIINADATTDADFLTINDGSFYNSFFYQISITNFQTSIKNNYNYFTIRPGGTVRVNVIIINSEKRIYVTGDLMDLPG